LERLLYGEELRLSVKEALLYGEEKSLYVETGVELSRFAAVSGS